MVDVDFAVENARYDRRSISPLMLFGLRVVNKTPERKIQHVSLQCQVRIEPTRRRYGGEQHERLIDLFGEPERWGETLHSFLWAHASVSVPGFENEAHVDLPVPCSYDFQIAATKYLYGLQDGDAPLSILFGGSIFYRAEDGRLQIEQVPSTKEASFRLAVGEWQAMMDHYYPDSAWLRLERDVFERLYAYKRRQGLPNWEQAIKSLLDDQPAEPLQ